MSDAFFPTKYGEFRIHACGECGGENVTLTYGEPKEPALVRIHSRCTTGDVFRSLRCDCGEQLEKSMEMITRNGSGIIIYLDQEGRGIGLVNKIKAYELQDKGYDTLEANHQLGFEGDARKYDAAAKILKKMGIRRIRLITNNPKKVEGMKMNGIEIIERVPLVIKPNEYNERYLKTKKEKMGHLI
ncbi:Riboflavin biosynthesis protein RibBA [uncultured archaeon]|nr:Riboflavin biosynthesis protein RibBA [uncultured archaeon]